MNRVFVHILQSDAMAVNIIPGFRGVEGELVRHYSNNRTILVMKHLVVERYAAPKERDDRRYGRDAP
jgi:hypothetical protein